MNINKDYNNMIIFNTLRRKKYFIEINYCIYNRIKAEQKSTTFFVLAVAIGEITSRFVVKISEIQKIYVIPLKYL